jgi:hypothetical protein
MNRVLDVGHWGMGLHLGLLALSIFIRQPQAEPEAIVTQRGAIPHTPKLDMILNPQLHHCSRKNSFWT